MAIKTFLTSDLHFSHKNIITFCKRPYFDVREMNQAMTDNWNSLISKEDLVYVLGDFSMHEKSVAHYLHKLNGLKILVRGNHDENSVLNEFDGYAHRIIINYNGVAIEMVHDPAHLSGKVDYAFCGHVHDQWKLMKKGAEMIERHSGRSYGMLPATTLNVGVDVHNMMPILLDDAVKLLDPFELLDEK
jgi:calcineurin-like phosphoesterase family protein